MLVSQSERIAFARPSGTQPPSARDIPPFVTTRTPSTFRAARASKRSLSPYARAVSKIVTPAPKAAAIVASERSSSQSSSVESRMQPRPTRDSFALSQGIEARSVRGVGRQPAVRQVVLGQLQQERVELLAFRVGQRREEIVLD